MPTAGEPMKLLILDGPRRAAEIALVGDLAVIGRDPTADIVLDGDPLVADFHCRLRYEHEQFWLEDLGSASATRVYGRPSQKEMPLFTRDVFRVGETRLALIDSDEDRAAVLEPSSADRQPDDSASPIAAAEDDSSRFDLIADPTLLLDQTDEESESPEVQRVRNRLRAIQSINADLAGETNPHSLLDRVLERIVRIVRAERAAVYLVPEQATSFQQLTLVSSKRRDGGEQPPEPRRRVWRKVLQERVAVLVDGTDRAGPLRSEMGVPLLREDRVAALLWLESSEPAAFSREELELVTVIANQAAAALANAELYAELHNAFEELKTAQEQLIQTEKLATVGGLAASIAHDIGNIITPISMVAAMVTATDVIEPELKESFNRQMKRLKALASQLLSVSNPRPPELAPTDLNQVARDSLMLVQTEARHGHVEIELDLSDELPPVSADGSRLDQAFVNIMLNAVQAMQPDGGQLRVRSAADGDAVWVSFADTGPGIPPEQLAKLGRPFFTTKGKAGNGLGVYGCKRIVEQEHGGRLDVQSTVGEGTVVTVHLPRRSTTAATPAA